MSTSAFGIEHTEIISKKKPGEPEYTRGREATATAYPVYHSIAAGKKGHKLRAATRSWADSTGGGIAGAAAGAGAGALAGKGRGAAIGAGLGAVGGSVGGAHHAFKVNNRKGHYKRQSDD